MLREQTTCSWKLPNHNNLLGLNVRKYDDFIFTHHMSSPLPLLLCSITTAITIGHHLARYIRITDVLITSLTSPLIISLASHPDISRKHYHLPQYHPGYLILYSHSWLHVYPKTVLLVIVSLRLETYVVELFGNEWMLERLHRHEREARAGFPSIIEVLIVIYIQGFILGEARALWADGLMEYVKDLWNIVDYVNIFFYMNWIFLRWVDKWYTRSRGKWA